MHIELLVLKKQVCLEENYRIPNVLIASYKQYLIINMLRMESLSSFFLIRKHLILVVC